MLEIKESIDLKYQFLTITNDKLSPSKQTWYDTRLNYCGKDSPQPAGKFQRLIKTLPAALFSKPMTSSRRVTALNWHQRPTSLLRYIISTNRTEPAWKWIYIGNEVIVLNNFTELWQKHPFKNVWNYFCYKYN